jgi:hypothetical protein
MDWLFYFGRQKFFKDCYDHLYVTQREEWDCGVACVDMATNFIYGRNNWPNFEDAGHSQNIRSRPLWTIELFQLLRHRCVDCIMITKYPTVAPHHYDMDWYLKNLDEEAKSINEIALQAKDEGWPLQERSMTTIEILEHLQQGSICIVLLNAIILQKETCMAKLKSHNDTEAKDPDTSPKIDGIVKWEDLNKDGYMGHYVLLIGYDESSSIFSYLDPAKGAHKMHAPKNMSIECFLHCWQSPGTDCDIIVIKKIKNK